MFITCSDSELECVCKYVCKYVCKLRGPTTRECDVVPVLYVGDVGGHGGVGADTVTLLVVGVGVGVGVSE